MEKAKKVNYYIPIDNSYAQCLDDNGENHALAGNMYEPKKIKLKVLVQSFKMKYYTILDDYKI